MIWCLHGAVGMASDWKPLAKVWAESGHQVRRVDLWRFLACEGVSLEDFGRALNEEARQGGEKGRNILVGYSMGGRLALHALLAEPELWSAAVIVSAHPGLQDEEECVWRMASDAEWAGKALTADWKSFLEEWSGQTVLKGIAKDSEVELEGFADRRALEPHRRAVARSFMEWSLGKQMDLHDQLPRISCPVLWVTGARDEKFSALGKVAVEQLPNGALVNLENAGHRAPWESSEAFAALVKQFLEKL